MTSPLLSNIEGLLGLSRRHGIDVRPTLLRVLTDIYVQKPVHSPTETREYATLALRLLDVVDAGTREVVRQKLAAYEATPSEVRGRLFGQDAGATTRTQTQSGGTAEVDHSRAVAPVRTATNAEHHERGTVGLDPTAFFAADATERRRMLAALGQSETANSAPMPPRDENVIQRLEQCALGARPADFVRELERALGVPASIAQKIVNDASGEPIVVAAKALLMPLPVLQRILLFVNPAIGHSVRRVYDLSALFEEIGTRAARQLVALWRSDVTQAAALRQAGASTARRVREPAAARERPGLVDLDEDLFLDRPQRTG